MAIEVFDMEHTNDLCPRCGGTDILRDYDAGEEVCTGCGLVVSEEIRDRGPEWRAFTKEEKDRRSRVGPGQRPSRRITGSTFYEREKGMTPEQRREWERIKRSHIRSTLEDSKDRNLAQAINELDRLAEKLNLPSYCIDQAAVYYRKALDKGLVRGRSIEAITAASTYAAVRKRRVPRTLKEVANASPRPKKEIARSYRLLLREFPEELKMPVPDARDYITKIAAKAGASQTIQDGAHIILTEANKRKILDGKDPLGLAAAALYIASEHADEGKTTQGELAKAAGVTEVTIRNRYKGLEEDLLKSGMPIEQIVEVYDY